jgi:hypothetical protein
MGFDTSLDKALARVEPSRPLSILPAQKIAALRPTQITIGMREVGAKLMKLDTSARPDRSALQRHLLPVILGPGQQLFLRDRHHLALALHRIGLESVGVALIADMSHMDIHAFWILLDRRNWVYPYDRMGTRRPFSEMPESVLALEDDPFRSLAG